MSAGAGCFYKRRIQRRRRQGLYIRTLSSGGALSVDVTFAPFTGPFLKRVRFANLTVCGNAVAAYGQQASGPIQRDRLTAINAWTVHLAYELRDTPIKVNAVHPGYVQTDMNGGAGEIDVPTGAKSSVEMALLDEHGPSGSFTHLGKTLPW